MTMKKSKTLQHIVAVAVVLLTLCLVFAAPVSAEGTGCSGCDTDTGHTHVAWIVDENSKKYYATVASAINDLSDSGGTVYLMGSIIDEKIVVELNSGDSNSVKPIKIYGVLL